MAQRFGRNQRRRAREKVDTLQQEVQNLQQALEMNKGLLSYVSEQKSALSKAMREARHILGESVALPAVESRIRPAKGATSFNAAPLLPMDCSTFSRATDFESATVQIQCMQLLLTNVDELPHSRELHCRVQLADGTWAYSISEQALHTLTPEMLELRLLPELSRQFARLIPMYLQKRRSWPR